MLKRILLTLLAALMLASLAVPASLAEGETRLVCDPRAPLSVTDGRATVALGTNASELLACFENKAAVTLTDAGGVALSATDKVGSGATLACGEDTATVVVPGDVDGNAKINARDVFCAMSAIVGVSGAYFADAADVDCDGAANGRDVVSLMRYLVGWDETFGAEHEKAASEDEALTVYFPSAMQRIARDDTAIHGGSDGGKGVDPDRVAVFYQRDGVLHRHQLVDHKSLLKGDCAMLHAIISQSPRANLENSRQEPGMVGTSPLKQIVAFTTNCC